MRGCERAVGLKVSKLQMPAPVRVGFRAPSCVRTHSRVPARSCLLTCMHISPWLYSFACTLSIRFSVLPVATVISLSLSPSLCSLGCFAASYFTMSLFIPFDNNNIRTYVQGPKVFALCRYIRKDPSKPVCWREKILIVSLLPGLAEAKGLIVEYVTCAKPHTVSCVCPGMSEVKMSVFFDGVLHQSPEPLCLIEELAN